MCCPQPSNTVLRAPQSSLDFKRRASQKRNESGNETGNSDEAVDPTDGESSSSFYSSFFKTESGSADESSDSKNTKNKSVEYSYTLFYISWILFSVKYRKLFINI